MILRVITMLPERGHSRLFVRRLWALTLRVLYLHIGSWPRLIEVFYWPTINLLIWGFTSLYIAREIAHANLVIQTLLAGILLSEVLIRVEMGTMVLFMEEIWSRNLGHLFAGPLPVFDYVLGLFGLSFIRMIVAISVAVLVAWALFGFSLLALGWPLVAYIALLTVNGWWYGLLLMALLIRFGLAAEWLAWMSTWVIIPLIAPYYPVSILPVPLQFLSHLLPATYVFESVKSLIGGHAFNGHDLIISLLLNGFYFVVSGWVFSRAYAAARREGRLLQMGE